MEGGLILPPLQAGLQAWCGSPSYSFTIILISDERMGKMVFVGLVGVKAAACDKAAGDCAVVAA